MAAVMFGLILHFQYAYGWSPVVAGLANLPMILTMLAAQPISELLARRHGHRIACVVGAVLLAGSLAGLAWAVEGGYWAIALFMVTMTIGLRTVMTICAVALVDATRPPTAPRSAPRSTTPPKRSVMKKTQSPRRNRPADPYV